MIPSLLELPMLPNTGSSAWFAAALDSESVQRLSNWTMTSRDA
jgi:hypothetical protein